MCSSLFCLTYKAKESFKTEKKAEWISTMQEELGQFKKSDVWDLVPLPEGKNPIGTKWIFKNKLDESGNIVRNKVRLVVKGYAQIEGIDFE